MKISIIQLKISKVNNSNNNKILKKKIRAMIMNNNKKKENFMKIIIIYKMNPVTKIQKKNNKIMMISWITFRSINKTI